MRRWPYSFQPLTFQPDLTSTVTWARCLGARIVLKVTKSSVNVQFAAVCPVPPLNEKRVGGEEAPSLVVSAVEEVSIIRLGRVFSDSSKAVAALIAHHPSWNSFPLAP